MGDRSPERDQDDDRDDARPEPGDERINRNWNELLQELRVTQTGVQLLTGFLLTLPFQQRFTDLTSFQRATYLVLVLLAATATGLLIAPVSLHRILFRKHLKPELVAYADRFARDGLAVLALVVTGTTLLIFDVVVGRAGALVAACAVLSLLVVYWLVVPVRIARRAGR